MKFAAHVLAAFFGLLFFIGLFFSVQTTLSLSRSFAPAGSTDDPLDLNIALFIPDAASLFLEQVSQGAREAAENLGVALTVHSVDSDSPELRMARYSGIDGAILYPSAGSSGSAGSAATRQRLEEFDGSNIPAVLLEHGFTFDSPWTTVGSNNFDVGRRIGEIAAAGSDDPVYLAVVYSEKSPGIAAEKELVEMGIIQALGDRLGAPVIRETTGLNPLDAENLTYQILRTMPEINTIAFTDTDDTLAAVQVIIDLNLVGTVRIIGFGSAAPVRDYIDRGIVAGSIVVNPWMMGYEAVRTLRSLIRTGYSPGYVDTGVESIRRTP